MTRQREGIEVKTNEKMDIELDFQIEELTGEDTPWDCAAYSSSSCCCCC